MSAEIKPVAFVKKGEEGENSAQKESAPRRLELPDSMDAPGPVMKEDAVSMRAPRVQCRVCPKFCRLKEGQTGFCRCRSNIGGQIVPVNYGRATSLALDPIEKKPLFRFYPGSWILSYGSFGCNFRCAYCQNSEISMAGSEFPTHQLTPESLADLAMDLSRKSPGNLGVAFTYNEPLMAWEFVRDTSVLLRESGLKSVVVTNGSLTREYADKILPYVDALNIDLKAFTDDYYRWIKADLPTTKEFVKAAVEHGCHVELTTLIVPGKNDSAEDMEAQAEWIASLSPKIPLHLSRYFPRYKVAIPMTPAETIYRLRDVAKKHLEFVYTGNL